MFATSHKGHRDSNGAFGRYERGPGVAGGDAVLRRCQGVVGEHLASGGGTGRSLGDRVPWPRCWIDVVFLFLLRAWLLGQKKKRNEWK